MSFWTGLAKLGAIGAAPFTGGASLAALPAIGAIGEVAGGAAGGMAKGRQAEDAMNVARDRNALDNYNSQNKAALEMPNGLTSQAMRSDIINHLQDTKLSGLPSYIHVPQMSGGLKPSLLGDTSHQAATQMGQQALSRLGQFGQQALPSAPQMTPQQKAGWFEKLMGGVGIGGSMAGAAAPLFQGGGGAMKGTY